MEKHLTWLVSYPKSGNTWMRFFLLNLIKDQQEPIDINSISEFESFIASDRGFMESVLGIDSSEYSPYDLEAMRRFAYLDFNHDQDKDFFIKVHDAYTLDKKNEPLFPADCTKAVIYIIRNPIDVVVSKSFHDGLDLDKEISIFNNKKAALNKNIKKISTQTRQILLDWSGHVESWTQQKQMPIKIVRYEDMYLKPMETFTGIAAHLGLTTQVEKIEKAIKFSSFEELKKQDEVSTFKERTPENKTFFREGKIGKGKNLLHKNQITKLIDTHGAVMKKYGYLKKNGDLWP